MWRTAFSRATDGFLAGFRSATPRYSQPSSLNKFHFLTQGSPINVPNLTNSIPSAPFSSLAFRPKNSFLNNQTSGLGLVPDLVRTIPCRKFIKMALSDGKKIADSHVTSRFFRLAWGGWIKRIAGSKKRVWKMSRRVKRRRETHVFVNRHFSQMFDRMVTRPFREEKFYVDDIYAAYQQRHGMLHPYYKPRIVKLHEKLYFPQLKASALAKRKELEAA